MSGVSSSSEPVPSELVPSELSPSELVPSELDPFELVSSRLSTGGKSDTCLEVILRWSLERWVSLSLSSR